MTETTRTAVAADGRPPGGATARRRRERAVPHPHADAVRGPLRGGPRADRGERRHDPRAGRDRLPRRAGRARAASRDAGADVDGERVRFPRGLAPPARAGDRAAEFTQVARNPEHNVVFGGANTIFAPAYGSPFVRDLDGGRRYGTIEDFRNFVKLAYVSPWLHHSGGTVCEPVDLPVNKRHYDMVDAHLRYSDKPFMGSVTHPQRARDTVEHGADRLRRRLPRGEHRRLQPDQRELAARLGLDDARRARAPTPRRTRR